MNLLNNYKSLTFCIPIMDKISYIKHIIFSKNRIINSNYKSNNKEYFNNAITIFFN